LLRKLGIFQVFLVFAVLIVALPTISAADPGNYSSLNDSVQSTASGGTIGLNQDYSYDNGTDSNLASTGITISKSMTIDGQGHTIDAKNSTRIFTVGANVQLTLKNLIMQNTVNSAISMGSKTSLTVINCTFLNNSGTYASISNFNSRGSTITVTNSSFINSTGQVVIVGGSYNTVVIKGTNFINNSVTASPGTGTAIVYGMTGDTITVSNSTFMGNTGGDGACFYSGATGSYSVINSTFINNSALDGAALRANSVMTVTNSTFINNTSTGSEGGGAIFGSMTITGCNFINNTASYDGGAIMAGGFNVINSTFIGNSATNGGALAGLGTVTNSIFCGNTATTAGTAINIEQMGTSSPSLTANNNWWGSNSPNFSSLISNFAAPTNWIYMNLTANNVPVYLNSSSNINVTANFNYLTDGTNITPLTAGTHIPNGLTVYFQTDNGQITPNSTTVNGVATAQYSYAGSASNVTANVDANPNSNNFTDPNLYNTTTFSFSALDTTPPTASDNLVGGLYNATQNVTLTMSELGTIYYTTDGSTPTVLSSVYSSPVSITSNTTLKYLAVDLAGNESPVYSESYTIDTTSPTATVNIKGGLYNTTQNVTLSMSEAGTIYYTLNGTTPTNSSTLYNGPIAISKNTTLEYIAIDNAGNTSSVYAQTYNIDTTVPTANASVKGGLYNTTQNVTLSMSEAGTIYYTLNGTTPTNSSTLYNGPIDISKNTTLKYIARDNAGNTSTVYTQTYTIDKIPPKVTVTTPTNKKTNVSRTSSIVIKFSEIIKNSTYYNKITIKNSAGKTISLSKILSGTTLTIKTSKRSANTWYTVTIPQAALKDNAGNNLTATYTFKFKTGK
jgi:predicted outer membrane repeat protein